MMTTKSNSIINALKRVERAGSDNSRATEKLREAVKQVARFCAEQLSTELDDSDDVRPDDRNRFDYRSRYRIVCTNEGPTLRIDICAGGDYYWEDLTDNPSKRAMLDFAQDIAGGLLDEIAAFLEDNAAKKTAATAVLEAADLKRKGESR